MKNSQKTRLTPMDYKSSIMDLLYANSANTKDQKQYEDPEPRVNEEMALEAMTEIQSILAKAATMTQEEIAAVRSGASTIANGALPNAYATTMANILVRLENMLYVFSDYAQYDSLAVWGFIQDHKGADCSKVEVQIRENKIVLKIPYLPKRNHGTNAVVNDMLAAVIYRHRDFPHWPKWRATFFHVYPTKTSGIPRDVDNYDYKKTIDLLAFALDSADNALNFDIGGKHTVFTDDLSPGVYIEVTQKEEKSSKFPDWNTN